MEEESNVRSNKLKGQRKPRAKKEEPEPVAEPVEPEDVAETEETEEETTAPEPKKEKAKPKKPTKPAVQQEEYDVSQEPDVVIHKRHKGVKPRKVIVITADSDVDSDDEKLPYNRKPKVELKKREKEEKKEVRPPPQRPPRKQNVGLIGGDPKNEPVDMGRGLPERVVKSKAVVVDAYIDALLGL